MSYSIGIEVPNGLKHKIDAFAKIGGLPLGEGMHIMLVGPKGLKGVRGVEQKLQLFCLSQPAFKITVGGPAVYEDKMLYLSVLPGAINMVRGHLAEKLGIQDEAMAYRPHLTLVRGGEADLAPLLTEARAIFTGSSAFEVERLTLFEQQKSGTDFAVAEHMPLTGR